MQDMLFLLLACTCAKPAEAPPVEPLLLKPLSDYVPEDPQAVYESCFDRVEGVETDGECETDADCSPAGCSSEVCVAAAVSAETYTTCETRLCFSATDTCGCQNGRCRWSLKTAP